MPKKVIIHANSPEEREQIEKEQQAILSEMPSGFLTSEQLELIAASYRLRGYDVIVTEE